MTDPLISVLIPCYNRAGTIRRCIASAQASGYARLELIVSDNGSTDGTADLVAELALADPRIVLLRHGENRGPLPNWRACLERAGGDLVHWLWSDDWIEPGFYRTLVDAMRHDGSTLAFAAARIVSAEHGWSYIQYSFPPLPRDEALARAVSGMDFPASPACALLPLASVRRHFSERVPVASGIDCNRRAIGCDLMMLLGALSEARTVSFHPEPLVNFNLHGGSITVSSGGGVLLVHYAWARLCWGRWNGLPRRSARGDVVRLLRARKLGALLRWLVMARLPADRSAS